MLEFQKTFLIFEFFNWISCNKSLKDKIWCFFSCFFCLTFLGLECFRSRKTASFQTKEIQKSGSTELHKWSENVVKDVKLLTVNCEFSSVIWVKQYDKFFVRHSASTSKFDINIYIYIFIWCQLSNSLTQSMLITAFLSIFYQKATGSLVTRLGSNVRLRTQWDFNTAPGTCQFLHNVLTH